MDFDTLKEFQKLAEVRNYTIAAEQLYTTEASLSRHIKKLEDEIGSPLFYRNTRHIELTQLGNALLPYAEKSTELKDSLDKIISENLEKESQNLNILTANVLDNYINYLPLLQDFAEEYPSVKININSLNDNYIELFKNNQCDIGFFTEVCGNPNKDFARIPLYQDRLAAILPSENPYASLKSVSIEELKGENFILYSKGNPMYDLCVSVCQEHGFQPRIAFTMYNEEGIFDMVEKNLGVALGSEYMFNISLSNTSHKNLVLCSINPEIPISFNLISPKHPNAITTHFINYLTQNKDKYMKVIE